jgi:hypothetical protein
MPKPVNLGDGLLRLSPGWYWYTIGQESKGYPKEQLDNLVAMGSIRIERTQSALWTNDKPGEWFLFEVLREVQFQIYPYTWGPHEAPKGAETTPEDVGQDWEKPKDWTDHVAEGTKDALDPSKSAIPWIVGGALGVGVLLLAFRLADRRR